MFFKETVFSSPSWLCLPTFSALVQESFLFSLPSPTFIHRFFFLLLYAFIFCCIYSWATNFYFFSFFWDIFLLHNLLVWFRNSVFLQLASSQCDRERSHVGGSDHESVSPVLPPGGFVHLNVLKDQRTYISALKFSTVCISEHVQ